MTTMERGYSIIPILLALTAMPCAHAHDVSAFVERFDALVSKGLPTTIKLPSSTLVVTARLHSMASFPGEPPATLYDAILDGDPAVVTRSHTGLDVTAVTGDSAHVFVLTPGTSTIEEVHFPNEPAEGRGHSARALVGIFDFAGTFDDDVESPGQPMDPLPLADSTAPLSIHVFLHDELRTQQARTIHAGYVAWWLRDMEKNVLPDTKLEVTYLQPIPGISDLPYGSYSSLYTWSERVDAYVASRAMRRSWKNRYILVTKNMPAPGKLGMALPERGVAVATLAGPYTVIAHELGHTFGATHAQAELRTVGWWPCATTMRTPYMPMMRNCYGYSAANVATIRKYVELKGYRPGPWSSRDTRRSLGD